MLPLKGPNYILAFFDKENDLYGEYLSQTFSPHPNISSSNQYLDSVTQFLNCPHPMALPATHTTPNQIKSVQLKN